MPLFVLFIVICACKTHTHSALSDVIAHIALCSLHYISICERATLSSVLLLYYCIPATRLCSKCHCKPIKRENNYLGGMLEGF